MPQIFTKKSSIAVFHVEILPEVKENFINWQAKLNALIASFPGFISLEFSVDDKNHWMIVERFYDEKDLSTWREYSKNLSLMEELRNLTRDKKVQEITDEDSLQKNGVTEVIIAEVSPEKEEDYRAWCAKIHHVEAKFPGFRGVYVQSPNQSQGKNWITLLQFDNVENLDRWLSSKERQEVLKESKPLITSLESHRVISPYAGWFTSIAKTGEIPSVWKQTMIVLLVLFPIVMMEHKYLSPFTQNFDISLRTFIGNTISVTLIAFPLMPIAIFFLGWWLSPGDKNRLSKTLIGTSVVVLLYLIEIFFFWNFVSL